MPATEHTSYTIASISKPFTSTGLMILVEKGLVDLDEPTVILHVHGKREHEHLLHTIPAQYPGALIGGSPGCKDIVDQHNPLGQLSRPPLELYPAA
ncbi:MAG: serine hydrolase [Spirochaetales bacterium]|nr:serine hydrolase [Spirochaetales bacterium]